MYILGINAYHGDVAAVLLEDGDLVAAVEEERFERVKHVAGFPTNAIRACLEIGGIAGAEVDHVAVSRDPSAHLLKKVAFVLKHRPSPKYVWKRLRSSGNVLTLEEYLADALGLAEYDLSPLHNVEHHPAHLASAFFVSPYEEAAICAIDAMGDFVSTSMAEGSGNSMEIVGRVHYPHSLGVLYTALTQYLGFPYYGDEYKVMGLAPYGEPTVTEEIRELAELKPGGSFELNLPYFRHWQEDYDMDWEEGAPSFGRTYTEELIELLGPARSRGEELTDRHRDIARSLQDVYEESVFHVLRGLHEQVPSRKLCLAGGCAMNSVANGKVRANTPFEEVYIQPAAADNGTALGAALHLWHEEIGGERTFEMDHAFWGPEYSDIEVSEHLEERGEAEPLDCIRYQDDEKLCGDTASMIADGQVIGWFQGRMEWGARALGNRSIVADPRRAETREVINERVKYREEFRPFAPSVLEEAVDEYFVDAAPDPFMQQVYPVREKKREEIPAVTHVDGTGRLQAVSEEANPLYYRLISSFADRTGVPVLLNTSFNENEPIVCTPEQALNCFFRTDMDAVVIGREMVRKRAPEGGQRNAEERAAQADGG